MFHKTLTTTTLFLCLLFSLSAQVETTDKADITWGAEGRIGKNDEFKELFNYGEKVYTLIDEGRKAVLVQYDENLKEITSLDVDYRLKRTSYEYVKAFQSDSRLYFVYREESRTSNMVSIATFYVDLESMTSDFQPVEIAKVNYDKDGGLSVHPIVAEDEKNILFIIDTHVYHGGPLNFDLYVLTKDLSKVWEKKDVRFKDRQEAHFSFKDFSLKEDGTLFMLGKEYPNGNSDKGSNTTVELNFVLLKISDQGTGIEELVLDVPNKGITSARFGDLNDGNIVVGGLYSTEKSEIVEGAFLQYIDKESLEVLRLTKKSINSSDLESEKYDLYKFTSFYVRDVFVDDENNVKFVAELEKVDIIATTSSGANGATYTSYDYYYYFSNLLVVSATPEGEIDWITSIKKDTKTENDGGKHGSIISIYDKEQDQISFIYRTDNPDDDGGFGKILGRDPKLTMYTTVSSEGKVEEEVLIDHNVHDYELVPARNVFINDDSKNIVVMADRKRKSQMIGVKFK